VGHFNLGNYYNYYSGVKDLFGNTGGLLMIRKNLFLSIGGFNENYISCFEDVELNMMCIVKGFKNYNNSDCVAYHYESQTRNEDPENIKKLNLDFQNNLIVSINSNIDKIKNHLTLI
jgi:GT2 family glycosyltransferase